MDEQVMRSSEFCEARYLMDTPHGFLEVGRLEVRFRSDALFVICFFDRSG